MRSTRIDYAIPEGALAVPESGPILVLRPQAEDDLSAFPRMRTAVVTGFRPDHDRFAAQGYATTLSGQAALVLVCLPRAKPQARALLAQAMQQVLPDGQVVVDGDKTDGIDGFLRDCAGMGATPLASVAKAHGRLVVFSPSPAFAPWQAQRTEVEGGFVTVPGVFSADGPDPGSVLLAAALPATLPARVADLGAGWGFLSRAILTRDGVRHLDVIEAEAEALDCARINAADPRAAFHWADATTFVPRPPWDAVVMNPPFHTGRAADAALGVAFLRAAQRGLAPSGSLWMVANRHLPYLPALRDLFKRVDDLGGDGVFRLVHARYPQRR